MKCKEKNTTITGYIDEQLGEDEVTRFEGHLENCRHCQMTVQAERKVKSLLGGGIASQKAPFRLRASIRRSLAQVDKTPSILSTLFGHPKAIVALAASVIIICLLSIQAYRTLHTPEATHVAQIKHMHARIECLGCHYADLSMASQKYCNQYGHSPAIMSDAGEIFSFIPNEKSQEISSQSLHSELIISGWVFYQANFIEIGDYQILEPKVAYLDNSDGAIHD